MSEQITEAERMRLEELFFYCGCLIVPEKDEHWISGWDEGESYCLDCAEEKVDELRTLKPKEEYSVDGGWGTEGDNTPFCETCHHRLDNSLLQHGCESEVDHFLKYGFAAHCPDDCLDMHRVISAGMWEPLVGEKDDGYFASLYKLCRTIIDENFWIMPNNDYRHMWE